MTKLMYEQAFPLQSGASPDLDLPIPAAFAGNLCCAFTR
jgi:hypothetical protein